MSKDYKLSGHFAEQSGLPWQFKVLIFTGGAIVLFAFTGCAEHKYHPCPACEILVERINWSVELADPEPEPSDNSEHEALAAASRSCKDKHFRGLP